MLFVTEREAEAAKRSFRTCAAEVAQLLGIDAAIPATEPRRARSIAAAIRKALLERAVLPEELFDPLMAAAVYDPDPSFCRWFVEPAVYVFGRRRVRQALLEYLRTGTDAERAGAVRARYNAGVPAREGRSPAYAPGTTRDPALDASQDLVDAWRETAMQIFTNDPDLPICPRLVWMLPHAREDYPPRLRPLLARARDRQNEHRPPHRPMGRRCQHRRTHGETGTHPTNRRELRLKGLQYS